LGSVYALQLLASMPDRVITAGLGGAGLVERDEELRAAAAALDPVPPEGTVAPLFPSVEALVAALDVNVDLASVDVPILCINGEYDRPHSKTQRLWREARTFQNVVVRGCDHLAACGFGVPIPPAYVAATTGFIRHVRRRVNDFSPDALTRPHHVRGSDVPTPHNRGVLQRKEHSQMERVPKRRRKQPLWPVAGS
jgi:pimeloyl-ACP methyl ester carboxylesterase